MKKEIEILVGFQYFYDHRNPRIQKIFIDECESWINEQTQHNQKYDYVLASEINSTSLYD